MRRARCRNAQDKEVDFFWQARDIRYAAAAIDHGGPRFYDIEPLRVKAVGQKVAQDDSAVVDAFFGNADDGSALWLKNMADIGNRSYGLCGVIEDSVLTLGETHRGKIFERYKAVQRKEAGRRRVPVRALERRPDNHRVNLEFRNAGGGERVGGTKKLHYCIGQG